MNSVREGMERVLANAVEGDTYLNINEEEALDWMKFKESYFKDDEAELDEINEQVYNCLKDFTEGESFDMVLSRRRTRPGSMAKTQQALGLDCDRVQ